MQLNGPTNKATGILGGRGSSRKETVIIIYVALLAVLSVQDDVDQRYTTMAHTCLEGLNVDCTTIPLLNLKPWRGRYGRQL